MSDPLYGTPPPTGVQTEPSSAAYGRPNTPVGHVPNPHDSPVDGAYPGRGGPESGLDSALSGMRRPNPFAVSGLVLGLVALALSWIPLVNVLALFLAAVGGVLGVMGLTRAKRGAAGGRVALAAIVSAVLAAIGFVASGFFLVAVLGGADSATSDLGTTAAQLDDSTPLPSDGVSDSVGTPTELVSGDIVPFGGTATFDDGLTVSVDKPTAFTPDATASVGEGSASYVRATVTLTNGTNAIFDPSMVFATATSGGMKADPVFDIENGIDGAPSTGLPPGRSVSFPIVFGVEDPSDVTVEVTVDYGHPSALFSNAT